MQTGADDAPVGVPAGMANDGQHNDPTQAKGQHGQQADAADQRRPAEHRHRMLQADAQARQRRGDGVHGPVEHHGDRHHADGEHQPAKQQSDPQINQDECDVGRVEQEPQHAAGFGHARIEKQGEHHQRGAPPQQLDDQQQPGENGHAAPVRPPAADTEVQPSLEINLAAAAGFHQAHGQGGADQQQASRQHQGVFGRTRQRPGEQPAQRSENEPVAQTDNRAAGKVTPTGGQPAKRRIPLQTAHAHTGAGFRG